MAFQSNLLKKLVEHTKIKLVRDSNFPSFQFIAAGDSDILYSIKCHTTVAFGIGLLQFFLTFLTFKRQFFGMARRSLKIKQGQVTAREEGKTENLNEIE